jgi:radial spoke head protein 3
VVKDPTNRYRELPNPPSNIMWDKRVVRGNTYSSIVT